VGDGLFGRRTQATSRAEHGDMSDTELDGVNSYRMLEPPSIETMEPTLAAVEPNTYDEMDVVFKVAPLALTLHRRPRATASLTNNSSASDLGLAAGRGVGFRDSQAGRFQAVRLPPSRTSPPLCSPLAVERPGSPPRRNPESQRHALR
jgi:hypothetical protein